jgi:hypothetical protein
MTINANEHCGSISNHFNNLYHIGRVPCYTYAAALKKSREAGTRLNPGGQVVAFAPLPVAGLVVGIAD